MKLLEEKIRSEGKALSETVLKVDSFINHQVDPVLMSEIGKTLASYYKDKEMCIRDSALTMERPTPLPPYSLVLALSTL